MSRILQDVQFDGTFPDAPGGPRVTRQWAADHLTIDEQRPIAVTFLKWEREGCVYLGGSKLKNEPMASPRSGEMRATYLKEEVERIGKLRSDLSNPDGARQITIDGLVWTRGDAAAELLDVFKPTLRNWHKKGCAHLGGKNLEQKIFPNLHGGRSYWYPQDKLDEIKKSLDSARKQAEAEDPKKLEWPNGSQAHDAYGVSPITLDKWVKAELVAVRDGINGIHGQSQKEYCAEDIKKQLPKHALRPNHPSANEEEKLLRIQRMRKKHQQRRERGEFDRTYGSEPDLLLNMFAAAKYLNRTPECVWKYLNRSCAWHPAGILPSVDCAFKFRRKGCAEVTKTEKAALKSDLDIVAELEARALAHGRRRVSEGWQGVAEICEERAVNHFADRYKIGKALRWWNEDGLINTEFIAKEHAGKGGKQSKRIPMWVFVCDPQSLERFLEGRSILEAAQQAALQHSQSATSKREGRHPDERVQERRSFCYSNFIVKGLTRPEVLKLVNEKFPAYRLKRPVDVRNDSVDFANSFDPPLSLDKGGSAGNSSICDLSEDDNPKKTRHKR